LNLLVEVDGSNITTNVRVVVPGLSDHFLVLSSVNVWRPMPTLVRYSFRDFGAVDRDDFAAMLEMTDIYRCPADDVDGFCNQIRSTVTAVLDTLAPLKTRTKRRGKRNSRWLSDAGVDAKRTRRQLERRWKRTGAESDRVAYRIAYRAANDAINASRSSFSS